MGRPGPKTTYRYSERFKATAVRLSQLPGIAIQDVAEARAFWLLGWALGSEKTAVLTRRALTRLCIPSQLMSFALFPSGGPQSMKQQSSSRKSLTNYRRLRSMKEADIVLTSEHPEAKVKHIVRGIVRHGLKVVPPKQSVSLRIDADVLAWFRSHGTGYQTRINAVLRAFTEAARKTIDQSPER